jgi:hypothetical protein
MKYGKIYNGYTGKADLLMNFQLCRAYLNENCSVSKVVEIVLTQMHGKLYKDEIAKVRESHGKTNAVIELPRLKIKATANEILANYVELRFDKMVAEVLARKENYPLTFRDIIERYI